MTQKFIEQLARGAGKILMSKYRKIKTVKTKSTVKDYLTQADLASDKFLVYQIKQAYPTHKIYSEERINGDLTDEYTWIIDPLDGTFGFVHELPMFCVSVALAYKNKIILSAIYDPIHDEMFTAVKGKGAFLNGKKIIRKKRINLNETVGSWLVGRKTPGRAERSLRLYKNFFKYDINMLRIASQSLTGAYVACGRFDFMICTYFPIWDLGATALLLQETGVKVTDTKGKPWRLAATSSYFCADPVIHRKFLPTVKQIFAS